MVGALIIHEKLGSHEIEIYLPESLQDLLIRQCTLYYGRANELSNCEIENVRNKPVEQTSAESNIFLGITRGIDRGLLFSYEELVAKLPLRLRKLSLILDFGSKLSSLEFPASVELLSFRIVESRAQKASSFPCLSQNSALKIMRTTNHIEFRREQHEYTRMSVSHLRAITQLIERQK